MLYSQMTLDWVNCNEDFHFQCHCAIQSNVCVHTNIFVSSFYLEWRYKFNASSKRPRSLASSVITLSIAIFVV